MKDRLKETTQANRKKGQVELSQDGVIEYSSDHTGVEMVHANYIQTQRKGRSQMDQSEVSVMNASTFRDTS